MSKNVEYLEQVTIRFAGDSGDGMQLSGTQFSNTSGIYGNSVNTFPDYPSEIRAPEGTLYGVSAYQLQFGSKKVNTIGDKIDALVAMNASSLKVNLANVRENGIIVANSAGFGEKNLNLAKYSSDPLTDGSLSKYKLISIDIEEIMKAEVEDLGLSPKNVERTKNIFALGLTYWMFSRPTEPTEKWLNQKFGKKPAILEANLRALRAGYKYGETHADELQRYDVKAAQLPKGFYRNITGNEAAALGMVAASQRSRLPLFLGSYPITPATEILSFLSGYKNFGVKMLQAEDEIAGICSAIGGAYGGHLAVTTTSGPGLSLKVEAMGLAVILELPLVIIDVQRSGPSTGMPTKPEQSDLLMAMYGRHGEAPMPIVAASSAADCFDMAFEASRLAVKYMTPVILLTDGYIAQGTEPWKIPNINELPEIKVEFATDKDTFAPYKRDAETLARNWAVPGTPGLEHRIGGLEKENITGLVSQDPKNHQLMTDLRAQKVQGIENDIPLAEVHGDESGELLVIGWGGTYGAIKTAVDKMHDAGHKVSYIHLKHLNPFPKNLGEVMSRFDKILVPELNTGHLKSMLQDRFLRPILGLNKVQGLPFKAFEIEEKLVELLGSKGGKA